MEFLAIVLFSLVFVTILKGYPVAFTLGGLSSLFAVILYLIDPNLFDITMFSLLPERFMGTINNYVLMAIPLFVFMGIMLEKSGLAQDLLETMAMLFGRMRGGLAISVIFVGGMLAASTGIVGATVATMGLISLPTMLKRGYNPKLASGVICASGTLGQIIPPSIVLVLLADTVSSSSRSDNSVDVGSLFSAAIYPGLVLVGIYVLYVVIRSLINKNDAPAMPIDHIEKFKADGNLTVKVIKVFVLPLLLIFLVLGSIFLGVASPTEASAIGALGAIVLTAIQHKLNFKITREVCLQTMKLTSMVFFILLGATTFTLVFRTLGGDDYLRDLIIGSSLSPNMFLLLVLLVMFVSGFFIDFIEIIFILVPVVTPVFESLGFNMLWVSILIALNLQTSFLTPPFGFSLFYLKGVAPPNFKTSDIYKGAIPFIIMQIIIMLIVFMFPHLILE